MDIELYHQPRLVNRIKSGDILEAMPGSQATAVSFKSKPSRENPSNVFGYCRGRIARDITTYTPGDVLVERVVPSVEEIVMRSFLIEESNAWCSKKKQVYLVIGTITPQDKDMDFKDPWLINSATDAIAIKRSALHPLQESLVEYVEHRKTKEYVFRVGGKEYSLDQILCSLREKKK